METTIVPGGISLQEFTYALALVAASGTAAVASALKIVASQRRFGTSAWRSGDAWGVPPEREAIPGGQTGLGSVARWIWR